MYLSRRNFHVGRSCPGFRFQSHNLLFGELRFRRILDDSAERQSAFSAKSIRFVPNRAAGTFLRADEFLTVIAAELVSGPGRSIAVRAGET
jgi:hypothetical protein